MRTTTGWHHRPYVDNIVLVTRRQTDEARTDLMTCGSIAAPCLTRNGITFENEATFKGEIPAAFIAEGVDPDAQLVLRCTRSPRSRRTAWPTKPW